MTNPNPAPAGKIFLVGLGPGSQAHMTARAREAIAAADLVIGYSTYIKLVADLLDGKDVIRKGMTEELDRCHEALAAARQGKAVALVSSGDSGVYGMAGPTYEVLLDSGWTPDSDIAVEVVPGASAVNACAALVGAPLTHDFCSISLSDLLTPWPVIAARLQAAAQADFVVALYNPKSGRRTRQIQEARRILLQHRAADTPVALVKSAYRRRQSVQFTTLEQMAEQEIGMLTTVLIGNSHTVVRHGLMVTPRGYQHKYAATTAGRARDHLHAGEQAGHSLSLGLDGWPCQARVMLCEADATPETVAAAVAMPLADLLAALALDDARVPGCPWQSAQVAPSALNDLLGWALALGPLCLRGGPPAARISLTLPQSSCLHWRGEEGDPQRWLCLSAPGLDLQLDWQAVTQGWLLGQRGELHSLCFLDRSGRPVFSLQPHSLPGTFDFPLMFDRAALAARWPLVPAQPGTDA